MFPKLHHVAALLALLSPACSSLGTRDINSQFRAKLSPGTQIYFPSDANYSTEVTQRWSKFEAPTYYAAIKPALASDVQTIVGVTPFGDGLLLADGVL